MQFAYSSLCLFRVEYDVHFIHQSLCCVGENFDGNSGFFLNFRGLRGDRFKLCVPKYSENIVYADYFEGANKFETYG